MSCKPAVTESYTSNSIARGPAGSMDFTVSSSGVMALVPGVGEKITKVDSVGATMAVVKEPVVASTTPVPIGKISLGKVVYELDGKSSCTRDFVMEMMPICNKSADPSLAQTSNSTPAVTQVATPLPDMVCAAYGGYQTKIWQKQFRVTLAGSEKDLANIKEVRYTVWHSYGKTFTATNLANKFDAGSSFATPITSWNIESAIGINVDGKEFPIAEATLTWTDDVLNKKAGTPCE